MGICRWKGLLTAGKQGRIFLLPFFLCWRHSQAYNIKQTFLHFWQVVCCSCFMIVMNVNGINTNKCIQCQVLSLSFQSCPGIVYRLVQSQRPSRTVRRSWSTSLTVPWQGGMSGSPLQMSGQMAVNIGSDGCEVLGQMLWNTGSDGYEILRQMTVKCWVRWLWNTWSDGCEILGQMAMKYWVRWLWNTGLGGYEVLGQMAMKYWVR